MKKYLFFFLLFFFIKKIQAQNTNLDYKRAIKIYNLTEYQRIEDSNPYYHYREVYWKFFHPTIAFQWSTKQKNFHEIELVDIVLNKYRTIGSDITSGFLSMRYEFILNLIKSKDVKWVPSISFGINPFYNRVKNIPVVSNTFPNYNTTFGTNAFFTPRLTYYTKSKFFIDLNFPFCFFDYACLINKTENPSIPTRNQTTKAMYINIPKTFSARIGIGLKF